MTLLEALQNTKCDVLRTKLEQFISQIANNTIPTEHCPVCSTDLRGSFAFQSNQEKFPGQGLCNVCRLGIQMHHHIEHAGHLVNLETKQLCQYDITMPVMLTNKVIAKFLHDKWIEMKMPRRTLTVEELGNWIAAAKSITKKYTIQ